MDAEEIDALARQEINLAALESAPASVAGVALADGRPAGPTLRDRYRRTMFFQNVDRIPNFEFGYWKETLGAWHEQGLPREITNQQEAYAYFGIEDWQSVWVNAMGLIPEFEYEVIEEDGAYRTYRDAEGAVARINLVGDQSIPEYHGFAIETRADWEAFKERLQPGPERIPANWAEAVPAYNRRDYPLAVNMGSLIGKPRNWIGFENICYMVYDEPELLEEIVETLCQLICDTLGRVLPDVEFDFASGWEDICFNSGPIVGYDFMRDIVMPRYQRITKLLRKHGCHIAWTDCDGDIKPIADIFWEGGLNCCFPVEVHGGSDPVAIRERFPEMRFQGGICKLKMAKSKQALREEMERLLPVVRQGGFIPGVDHRVPTDVPLENYKYYLKLKRDLYGVGGEPQYDESRVG